MPQRLLGLDLSAVQFCRGCLPLVPQRTLGLLGVPLWAMKKWSCCHESYEGWGFGRFFRDMATCDFKAFMVPHFATYNSEWYICCKHLCDGIVTSCHPWAGITSWVLGSLWPLHDSCLFANTLRAFSIGRERLNSKIQRGQDTKPFAENHFWSCFASHIWAQQCCLNHAVIEHMKQWKPLTSSRMLQCSPIAGQTCQSWILTACIPQNLLWFKGFKRNVSKIPQCHWHGKA